MAKPQLSKRATQTGDELAYPAPSSLAMSLFAPGMSILHRAGLGGLACTLRAMERDYRNDGLDDKDVPGGPWPSGARGKPAPPWTIDARSVSLDFERAEDAPRYLKRLFVYAFQVCNGLIYLPGQHGQSKPGTEVLVELQNGITLTFLQHGKVRKLAKTETTISYDPEQTGVPQMTLIFKKCQGYKHQDGWQDLISCGVLRDDPVEVIGPLSPGSVVRHNAFPTLTKIEDDPAHILPLYFALVGCMALPINRGCGVLIVPDVDDLESFVRLRPLMTPKRAKDCRITSAGDAVLQAQVRLRGAKEARGARVPECYTMTLRPTPWARQQKSRVSTIHVEAADEPRLDRFKICLAELSPRVARYTVTEGKGKNKKERIEYFWADSMVRPLFADNLALNRPWYTGFARLMTALDDSNRPLRDKVAFERKGLHNMIDKVGWESTGEKAVVDAVHDAIRRRYAQIADENKNNHAAMKNRWKGEYDRWRLAFAGAKTADQLRFALVDLWSRAGGNAALREHWADVLPLVSGSKWQLTRDLALLALASYRGREAEDGPEQPSKQGKIR